MNKPTKPMELLCEIEAYLSLKLSSENQTIPVEDMHEMLKDIRICLEKNGVIP